MTYSYGGDYGSANPNLERRAPTYHCHEQLRLGSLVLYCIGASVLFWGVLYFTLIAPPMPQLAPQTFVAIALTVMTALIIPLFWSILVPTTPAGQLLQKTQWGTIGFWVILGGALYMTWYAKLWIGLWWASQQIIVDNGLSGAVTVFCLIGFILVPSLAWTVVTPERWLIQIHQAREVRKIERMQQLEDLSYKAMIARTRAILNAELAGTAASRIPELAGLLLASERLVHTALYQVAQGYSAMYNAELRLGLEAEPEVEERYRSTVNQLVTAYKEIPNVQATALPDYQEASVPAPKVAQPALARLSAPARQNYIAARNVLGDGAWMRRDLESALSCQHSEASERIREWKAAGIVVDVADPKWHYRFTEVR
ncbi:MAG: hypothetical protein IPP13_23145 [Kouleothrix sp.]|nr:hypothetical protein [Kouleothrix sp.]